MASRFRTAGRTGMRGLLVRRLREEGRGADAAFTVAELRRSLLPYPRCREALGLTSKAEYDVSLLRLLDGDDLVVSEDPELDEEVERELDSPEPGLGILDDHAATVLRPASRLERELTSAEDEDGEEDDATSGARGAGEDVAPASGAAEEGPPRAAGGPDEEEPPAPGAAGVGPPHETESPDAPGSFGGGDVAGAAAADGCPACHKDLPEADGVRYCPHCGEDVQAPRCAECGGELDAGWRYCPFCGSDRHA